MHVKGEIMNYHPLYIEIVVSLWTSFLKITFWKFSEEKMKTKHEVFCPLIQSSMFNFISVENNN